MSFQASTNAPSRVNVGGPQLGGAGDAPIVRAQVAREILEVSLTAKEQSTVDSETDPAIKQKTRQLYEERVFFYCSWCNTMILLLDGL